MATAAEVVFQYINSTPPDGPMLLQKALGEGSRGGRVVGHTSSGKAIYAKHADRKMAIAHYSTDDHRDASTFHHKVSQAHRDRARAAENKMDDPEASRGTTAQFGALSSRHNRLADHHERVGDWHHKHYSAKTKSEEIENAREFEALNQRDGMVA